MSSLYISDEVETEELVNGTMASAKERIVERLLEGFQG